MGSEPSYEPHSVLRKVIRGNSVSEMPNDGYPRQPAGKTAIDGRLQRVRMYDIRPESPQAASQTQNVPRCDECGDDWKMIRAHPILVEPPSG